VDGEKCVCGNFEGLIPRDFEIRARSREVLRSGEDGTWVFIEGNEAKKVW
jgi:hypothetical protein